MEYILSVTNKNKNHLHVFVKYTVVILVIFLFVWNMNRNKVRERGEENKQFNNWVSIWTQEEEKNKKNKLVILLLFYFYTHKSEYRKTKIKSTICNYILLSNIHTHTNIMIRWWIHNDNWHSLNGTGWWPWPQISIMQSV